jgi:hypothetical protein
MIVLFPLGVGGKDRESVGALSVVKVGCAIATFPNIELVLDIWAVAMPIRIIAAMICSIQHIPHHLLNATFLDKQPVDVE